MSRGRRTSPLGQKIGNKARQLGSASPLKFDVSPTRYELESLEALANFAPRLLYPVNQNKAANARVKRTLICDAAGAPIAQLKLIRADQRPLGAASQYEQLGQSLAALPALLVLLKKNRVAYQVLGPPKKRQGNIYTARWDAMTSRTQELYTFIESIVYSHSSEFKHLQSYPLAEFGHEEEWQIGLYGFNSAKDAVGLTQDHLDNWPIDYGILASAAVDLCNPQLEILCSGKVIFERLSTIFRWLENPPDAGSFSKAEYNARQWRRHEMELRSLIAAFTEQYGVAPADWE
jgi:hypothetical protein